MVTDAQNTSVDYRGGWIQAGKGNSVNLIKANPIPAIEVENKFETLAEPLDDAEFPVPNPVGESRVKHRMPRITRASQRARTAGKCDADSMGNSEFGSLMKAYRRGDNCIEKCCTGMDETSHVETVVTNPITEYDDKIDIEFDGKQHFDPYNTNMATVMMANAKRLDLEVGPTLKE